MSVSLPWCWLRMISLVTLCLKESQTSALLKLVFPAIRQLGSVQAPEIMRSVGCLQPSSKSVRRVATMAGRRLIFMRIHLRMGLIASPRPKSRSHLIFDGIQLSKQWVCSCPGNWSKLAMPRVVGRSARSSDARSCEIPTDPQFWSDSGVTVCALESPWRLILPFQSDCAVTLRWFGGSTTSASVRSLFHHASFLDCFHRSMQVLDIAPIELFCQTGSRCSVYHSSCSSN